MKNFRKYLPYFLIFALLVSAVFIGYLIYQKEHPSNLLKVAFLDVGQGDSIYIEAPNGTQMLIDGGVSGPVLMSQLGKIMSFGDRSIDVVLATHPDADHIGGLVEVFDNYKVDHVFENGLSSTSKTFQNLEDKISKHKVDKIIARKGMHVVLDKSKNIYFDILFPDRDVSNFDSNDASIVGRLVYGNESFMLTGDASVYEENLIMQTESSQDLNSQVLKLGHHGSHSASSRLWLENVKPDVAIISAGKNNRYGHPHQDILDRLNFLKIPYLSTTDKGAIVFETNGIVLSHN